MTYQLDEWQQLRSELENDSISLSECFDRCLELNQGENIRINHGIRKNGKQLEKFSLVTKQSVRPVVLTPHSFVKKGFAILSFSILPVQNINFQLSENVRQRMNS